MRPGSIAMLQGRLGRPDNSPLEMEMTTIKNLTLTLSIAAANLCSQSHAQNTDCQAEIDNLSQYLSSTSTFNADLIRTGMSMREEALAYCSEGNHEQAMAIVDEIIDLLEQS